MARSFFMPLATAILCTVFIAGCNEEKPSETVQTVDWYKANVEEMKTQLAKCDSNPGQLALTPNCVNARKASEDSVWESRKGIVPPKPPTFNRS